MARFNPAFHALPLIRGARALIPRAFPMAAGPLVASSAQHTFLEFFAGAGMARLGLGAGWRCLLANDISDKKAAAYLANFPGSRAHFHLGDVADVDLDARGIGDVDLAWASFPCQDLSLAGGRSGLAGKRSGAFWSFWGVATRGGRRPRIVVLENVVGLVTSHGGADLEALVATLAEAGYSCGPMVVDAALFVPQSRPRLFLVAVHDSAGAGPGLEGPVDPWHPASLRRAFDRLPESMRARWRWWGLPVPPPRRATLADVLEPEPDAKLWHSPAQVAHILALMSDANRAKLREAQSRGGLQVGAVYRRTRPTPDGSGRVQRAEVRFDGLGGCLRTPAGGSSRQVILLARGDDVRTRLLSPREAARLMGVPDSYQLPANYNEAYHLMGDGVCVPAVGWLARGLLDRWAGTSANRQAAA